MNSGNDSDVVSELFESDTIDQTSQNWKTITDCLEQMKWADNHCASPSPTPVANAQSSPHKQQSPPSQLTKYRKSDGDLHAANSNKNVDVQPIPQTAPILFSDKNEFKWEPKSHLRSNSAHNTGEPNQPLKPTENPFSVVPKNFSLVNTSQSNSNKNVHSHLESVVASNFLPFPLSNSSARNNQSASTSSISSGHSHFSESSSKQALSRKVSGSSVKELTVVYTKNPSPYSSNRSQNHNSNLRLKSTIEGNVAHTIRNSPGNLSENKTESLEEDEYTKVLLQHQCDRMNRLHSEFESKQQDLDTLMHSINQMNQQLVKKNARKHESAPALPALQSEINKLREENRRLEIDCSCMYREVDLYSKQGDSTREDFYSRYNRNSQQVSKQQNKNKIKSSTQQPHGYHGNSVMVTPLIDEFNDKKWRCKHCTFDNHYALENCEICEYRRDTVP